jgi:hypothetical protein
LAASPLLQQRSRRELSGETGPDRASRRQAKPRAGAATARKHSDDSNLPSTSASAKSAVILMRITQVIDDRWFLFVNGGWRRFLYFVEIFSTGIGVLTVYP